MHPRVAHWRPEGCENELPTDKMYCIIVIYCQNLKCRMGMNCGLIKSKNYKYLYTF